jgi:hypothetical protein
MVLSISKIATEISGSREDSTRSRRSYRLCEAQAILPKALVLTHMNFSRSSLPPQVDFFCDADEISFGELAIATAVVYRIAETPKI